MLVLDTIKDYLASYDDSVVIFEGLNSSGKTTICKELIGSYPYFKSVGLKYFDGKCYEPSILKLYRVIDRYRPIQDFISSVYEDHDRNFTEEYFTYGLKKINEFTKKYIDSSHILSVFLIHHRYLSNESKRSRPWLTDDYFDKLSMYYHRIAKGIVTDKLVVTKDTIQLTLRSEA